MRLRLLFLLLFAALALVSCGEESDQGGVEDLLDRAFRQSIKSADLKVDALLSLKGTEDLGRPVRIQASGPFRTNEGRLPSADLELKVGTEGGGQTVQTGFLSTGDRAFVKFEDVYYEQPAAQVRAANASIRKAGGRGSLRELGLNPRAWLLEASEKGDERVAGVETSHVSGRLDVGKLMSNISEFVQRSAPALTGATGQAAPQALSKKDIEKLSEVVKDPTFDVYVGKKDHVIRRVSGRIEFDVPEDSRKALNGIEGGTIEFSVEFADVNGDQEIEAPAEARPLSELTRSLGGASLLGAAGDQAAALGGGTESDSGGGSDTGVAPLQPNGTGTSPNAPDAEDFNAYADCLDKAQPEDTDALQRCSELLYR
ncbi:MAG: hypothetical protein JW895_17870 [Thermoleophilaceae bacterium]|nr:hypothetical protein [Thermoleophilaceae bacterium]